MRSFDSMNGSDLSSISNGTPVMGRFNPRSQTAIRIGASSAYFEDFSDAVLYLGLKARRALNDAQMRMDQGLEICEQLSEFNRHVCAMAELPCRRREAIAEKMRMALAKVSGVGRHVLLADDLKNLLLASAQRDQFAGLGVLA